MPILEGIPVSFIALVVGSFGTPGIIIVFWYVDQRKFDRVRREDIRAMHEMREDHQKDMQKVLDRYKDDVRKITHFYETNVELVKNYEKLANDLSSVIHLNIQVQTQLVEQIKNNTFCPMVRKEGPGR